MTDALVAHLLDYRTEDLYVDYKQDFPLNLEKSWLSLVKDCHSFANGAGGFIVYGVQDKTWEAVGLSTESAAALSNNAGIRERLRTYVQPAIDGIRCHCCVLGAARIAVIAVPPRRDRIHVFIRDGKGRHPTGDPFCEFHEGSAWIRAAGGNRPITADDIESHVQSRIAEARNSDRSGIAKIFEAPSLSTVEVTPISYVLPADFAVSSGVDSNPGLARAIVDHTVPPNSMIEVFNTWLGLLASDSKNAPPEFQLWRAYVVRRETDFEKQHKNLLAIFSLLNGLPTFYWLRRFSPAEVEVVINRVIALNPSALRFDDILSVAAFLGRAGYARTVKKLQPRERSLFPSLRAFPIGGPRQMGWASHVEALRKGERLNVGEKLRARVKHELRAISQQMASSSATSRDSHLRDKAFAYDAYLYAPDEKFPEPRLVPAGPPTDVGEAAWGAQTGIDQSSNE